MRRLKKLSLLILTPSISLLGVSVFGGLKMKNTYAVYLDEFGHIGPYISHNHPQHKTHPVFGLGGFVIPLDKVRHFSSFFFNLKKGILNFDIKQARDNAIREGKIFQLSTWEKKGSQLYSVKNLEKYKNLLTGVTNKIVKEITKNNGFLFYVGEEKKKGEENNNPQIIYRSSLCEIIKRLDNEFKQQDSYFMIFMDDSEESSHLVKRSIYEMHQNEKFQLIEAPMQVDSKLYQTVQCADWLCSIYGKLYFYELEPENKPTYSIFHDQFKNLISSQQKRSNVRRLDKKASMESLGNLCKRFNSNK